MKRKIFPRKRNLNHRFLTIRFTHINDPITVLGKLIGGKPFAVTSKETERTLVFSY